MSDPFALYHNVSTPTVGSRGLAYPQLKSVFHSMTPEKKLEITLRLYHFAKELKAVGFQMQNPNWSQETIQDTLRLIFLNARS